MPNKFAFYNFLLKKIRGEDAQAVVSLNTDGEIVTPDNVTIKDPISGVKANVNVSGELATETKLVDANGVDIDVQTPMPTNGDRVYAKDIDVSRSDIGNFSGAIVDLFTGLHSAISDTTGNATKVLLVHFQWPVFTSGITLECNEAGNFSNIKLEIFRGGGEGSPITILDDSADSTKLKVKFISMQPFGAIAFDAFRLTFTTTDDITLTDTPISKVLNTASFLLALDEITGALGFISQRNGKLNVLATEKEYDYYVNKYGINNDVDTGSTPETVWDGSVLYTYTTTAQDYYISSSSALDVTDVTVELLVEDGADWVREYVTVALQGQTSVQLTTASTLLAIRSNRAFNSNGAVNVGDVYIYETTAISGGVPIDITKVKSIFQAKYQQTEQAVYSVPSKLENGTVITAGHITKWRTDVVKKTTISAEVGIFTRAFGKIFRNQDLGLITDAKSHEWIWGDKAPNVVSAKSDIEIRTLEVSANDAAIAGRFQLELIPE